MLCWTVGDGGSEGADVAVAACFTVVGWVSKWRKLMVKLWVGVVLGFGVYWVGDSVGEREENGVERRRRHEWEEKEGA